MSVLSFFKKNKYSISITTICTITGIITIAAGAPVVGILFILGACCSFGYFFYKMNK